MRPIGLFPLFVIACAALLVSVPEARAENGKDASDRGKKEGDSKNDRDWGKDRDRDSDRSDSSRHRRDFSHYRSAFDHLSEEERARIRSALQQVWSDPEVIAAKKNLQESTDHYRETLRTALAKVDPEMQSILKKMMMGPGGPGPGRGGPSPGPRDWGDPNRPGFARSVLLGSHKEFADRVKPELREKFQSAHGIAIETPAVREALQAIEEGEDGKKKLEGVRLFRDAYRAAIIEAAPELKPFIRSFSSGMRPPGTAPSGNNHRDPGPPEHPGDRPPRPPSDKRPPAEEKGA